MREFDRKFSLHHLRTFDKELLRSITYIKGIYIAGGAALAMFDNKPKNIVDWDIYTENWSGLMEVQETLNRLGFKALPNKVDDIMNFDKKGTKVQVISKFMAPMEGLFNYFDLSICCVGYKEDKFYVSRNVHRDIRKKKFNFISTTSPKTVKKRVKKYINRGYKPSKTFWKDFEWYLNTRRFKIEQRGEFY